MKNRILLFVYACLVCQIDAQTCTNTPTHAYGSQSQLNQFSSSTQNHIGDIYLVGPSEGCNDINSLSPLSNLQTISGDLVIIQSCNITSLEPLSNLTSVGGCVRIEGGPTSLNGFRNLRTIGGNFQLSRCAMTSLNGLENLTSIGGSLTISDNFLIADLSALNRPIPIGGTVRISGNQNITGCAMIAICNKLTGANIANNAPGCNSVAEVTTACTKCPSVGNLSFTTQTQINNFGTSYPNCDIIKGNMTISGANITNLNGLSGVTTIKGTLTIQNTSLTNLTGLGALQTVESDISITANPTLTSLLGIGDYNWFNTSANLTITNNPSLSNCSAYAICSELCGSGTNITISGNAAGCMNKSAAKATCAIDNYQCGCLWIGGASGDWNVATNWQCGQVPDATYKAIISDIVPINITISANTTINNVESDALILHINNATVSINNAFLWDFTANLTNSSLVNTSASKLMSNRSFTVSPVSGTNSIINCGSMKFAYATMTNITVPFTNCTTPGAAPVVKGCGTLLYSSTFVNSGTLAPGCSPGTIVINPSVTNLSTGTIEIEIENSGTLAAPIMANDLLRSTGNIQLAGTLKILTSGAIPNGTYTIIESISGTKSGTFTSVTYNGGALPSNVRIDYTSEPKKVKIIVSALLSVELIDFKAKNTEGGNFLSWQTANEINNKGFQIERSFDGKTFENIGFVKAVPQSPKGAFRSYEFLDVASPLGAGGTYYRLRQIDNDGKETLSKVVNVRLQKEGFSIKTYPNPFKENVIVEISTDKKTDVTIELIDILGRQIFSKKAQNTEGVLSVPISTEGWANGTYFLKISDRQATVHQKVIKH